MFATSKKLKGATMRGTTDTGSGEGDPTGLVEILEVLKEHPNYMSESVKNLKARIKEPNQTICCIAMDLLHQCMQNMGFEFQLRVAKKILPLILQYSTSADQHPQVQQKAAAYINIWANAYGNDSRLVDFSNAAAERLRIEEARRAAEVPSHCAVTASGCTPIGHRRHFLSPFG